MEGLVAVALYRAAEPAPVESSATPQRVFYWRSTGGREVDFLVRALPAEPTGRQLGEESRALPLPGSPGSPGLSGPAGRGPREALLPIEVKFQASVSGHDREALRRAFGRGLLLSRDTLDLTGPVRTIPVPLFLWLLRSEADAPASP